VSHPVARLALGLAVFVLVGWGVGELWTSVVGSADLDAVREVAAQRTAAMTQVARVITWTGSAFLLVPLALIVCLVLGRSGLRREALAVALSLGGAMLISDWVKLLVSRPRPPVEHLQAVSGASFPSGHATQASAFWFSLVFVLPAAGAPPKVTRVAAGLALLLVLAVAWSRVYLGVHYPSDVVAGLLLGTGWAVYVSRCMRGPRLGDESGRTTGAESCATRGSAHQALAPDTLAGASQCPRREHAGGGLLPTLAPNRGRAH
jgi:membrane-associated phospholipid phosphatase